MVDSGIRVVIPAREPLSPGVPVHAGVDFISPVTDYEFGYCTFALDKERSRVVMR